MKTLAKKSENKGKSGSFFQPARVYPKLTVNAPNDKYEQEADAMADRVMRMPDTSVKTIQRKCSACEEEEVQRAPIMRQAQGGGFEAPAGISSELQSSKGRGGSLPDATNARMSQAFGTDFSNVRVHTGSQAANMSQNIQAKAFTHGSDIYFNKGAYQPGTNGGDRLLAHELTHVVQQGAGIKREAISGMDEDRLQRAMPPENMAEGTSFPLPYREATELHECVRIMGEDNYDYCHQEVLGVPAIDPVVEAMARRHRLKLASCDALPTSWADFQGTAPNSSSFGATTRFNFTVEQVENTDIVKANFLNARSWVKPQFSNPRDGSLNGCDNQISSCEAFFQAESAAGRSGGSYRLGQPTGCAASIGSNPSLSASNESECASVLGNECQRVSVIESQRLLRHEIYHFKIACEIAKKGTLAILRGSATNATRRRVRNNANAQTRLYDNQTTHGCNQAQQTAWETAIDSGLPAITIP